MGEEQMILEHVTDRPTFRRHPFGLLGVVEDHAVERDPPRVEREEPGEHR